MTSVWDDLDNFIEELGDQQSSASAASQSRALSEDSTTMEGLQHSVPAASLSWADLDDEEMDDMNDRQQDSLTAQQRLCRERYLALESVYSEEHPLAEASCPDNYDDDFDLEEDPEEEAFSRQPEVDVASEGDPVEDTNWKVNEHGIRATVIMRLWNTYDVQHRHAFNPLTPRADKLRECYPEHEPAEKWVTRSRSSRLRQTYTVDYEEETPLIVTPEEITASAETPVTTVLETRTPAVRWELTASAENPPAADEEILVDTVDHQDTDSDNYSEEATTSQPTSEDSWEITTPVETPILKVQPEAWEITTSVENPLEAALPSSPRLVKEPSFRRYFFVKVIDVLVNARKVANATIELIR